MDGLIHLRLQNGLKIFHQQHQFLDLFNKLHCTNYTHTVTLNLTILHWLKANKHPVWKTFVSYPVAFSEHKGETSLSFLSSMSGGQKEVTAWRDNYLLLPYCRQITLCYQQTWHTKPKSNKGRPLKLPADEVALLVSKLLTTIEAIVSEQPFAYEPLSPGNGYPAKQYCNLSTTIYKKHYSITPDYSFLPKLLQSLNKTVWHGNLWGSTLLRHFPPTHPTYLRYLDLLKLKQSLENESEFSGSDP